MNGDDKDATKSALSVPRPQYLGVLTLYERVHKGLTLMASVRAIA